MTNHTADERFVDLEIRVFQRREEGYPVEITLGGQQEFSRGYLSADILPWVPSTDPVADGQRLFDALFADSVLRSGWAEARGRTTQRRVRLRIDVGAAELHALPWELLQEDQVMISADACTPFSRYLPVALPWGGAVEERPIRVLVVISNPGDLEARYDLAQLDVALERSVLEEAFGELDASDIQLDFLEAPVTLERLEETLRQGHHVLHYLGHGVFSREREQAALYLQDGEGNTRIVTDDALIGMLSRQRVRPRLVFLAACQSATRSTADAFLGLGPKLVAAGVPAVVAMQDFIAVRTARKLSSVFYRRLAEHGVVDRAVNEARSTLVTAGRPDAAVPVLFMRLKSGELWGSEADVRGEVLGTRNPRIFWTGLVRMIQEGRCTPIIGPRVHGRWLPTPQEIARHWSDVHTYPFADKDDLARVAQYMATNQGEDFPRCEFLDMLKAELIQRLPEGLRPETGLETLTALIQAVGWSNLVADDPNEVHRTLAGLSLPLYVTTNCDSFMVEALAAQGRQPVREISRWSEHLDWLPSQLGEEADYEPSPEAPLVYHLFGSDEEMDSLVLTEDHYLNFLVRISAERDRIPNVIRGALSSSMLMFVGYSLYDWEFRAVMHGLVASMDQRRRFKHVAVQLSFEDAGEADTTAVQTFLQQYFQDADINVFWGTTVQFIAELREHWEVTCR
jgi:hypothetical protein